MGCIAGNAGTLLKTVNGGINWESVSLGTTKDLSSLTATNGYTYVLAGFVYGYGSGADEFYKTNDNVNWTSGLIGTPNLGPSKLFFQNDNLGYCVTANCTTNGDCGIFIGKSTDSGQLWLTSYDNWNPPSMIGIAYADIVFVTDSIGYALSGNNILKTSDGGTFVGIDDGSGDQSLKPALSLYPNPAAYLCSITFTIDKSGPVSFEILNANGSLICRKEIGYMQNGENTYNFNLLGFSTGLYFIRVITRNMVLCRMLVKY
jgi:hypothetical protein